MKLKILVAASALLASGVSIADAYQSEVNARVARTDIDGVSSKENTYGIDGAYYFNAVKTSNVPLAEAAYLGKNSNVHAAYARAKISGQHIDYYDVGAEFFIPESFLYVDAGANRWSANGYEDNDWYTTVGLTPIDGLLVSTSYAHDEGYDANIKAKYVTALGAGEFINVEAEFRDDDDSSYKAIGADYYFDSTFSVGGELENQYSDNSYTVRTRKFFTEQVSGELSYTDRPDGNIVMAGASVRF